jgi:hypothetical protein
LLKAGPSSSPQTGIRIFLASQFQHKYALSLGSMPFEEWRLTFSRAVLIHVERIITWTRTAAGPAYRAVP